MRLIDNWAEVALKSYSMWAVYIGIALILVPEIALVAAGRQVFNPYLTTGLALLFLIAGGLGRLLRQPSLDLTKVRSSAVATFLAIAIPLIVEWEGMRNHAYLDIVGVPTICMGHTAGVQLGDFKTDAECEALLHSEVLEYREGLHRYFTPETLSNRLTAERDAAYVSLAYNVGVRGAGRSTAVKRLNAGNIQGGCRAITWWNKAGGRVVRGLVRRRGAEFDLCMIGVT